MLKRVMLRIPLLKLILRGGVPSFYHLLGALVVVGLGIGLIAPSEQKAYLPQPQEQDISAAEFSRMIREFSAAEMSWATGWATANLPNRLPDPPLFEPLLICCFLKPM